MTLIEKKQALENQWDELVNKRNGITQSIQELQNSLEEVQQAMIFTKGKYEAISELIQEEEQNKPSEKLK